MCIRLITFSFFSSKTLAFLSFQITHQSTANIVFQIRNGSLDKTLLCHAWRMSKAEFEERHRMPKHLKKKFQIWLELRVLLTQDNVCNRCYLSLAEDKNVDHLFMHFPVTNSVWEMFLWVWNCLGEAYVSRGRWRVMDSYVH